MNADRVMVGGCSECPFRLKVRGTDGACQHPSVETDGLECSSGDDTTPDACPLHSADALVYLKNPRGPR